jgi:hypothetical protein
MEIQAAPDTSEARRRTVVAAPVRSRQPREPFVVIVAVARVAVVVVGHAHERSRHAARRGAATAVARIGTRAAMRFWRKAARENQDRSAKPLQKLALHDNRWSTSRGYVLTALAQVRPRVRPCFPASE